MLQAIFRGNDEKPWDVEGTLTLCVFFLPLPPFFERILYLRDIYGILWDFDYGILMDSYGISHDSTLGFYGYPPAICQP